jgi:hydrogenase expression/formation protein HypD
MENKLESIVEAIRTYDGPPIRLMEVCGTHTNSISKFGIPSLFPENISLISGPGCPVCVTPAGYIDRVAELSLQPGCTVLSFGDMIRVPGNRISLLKAKAEGGSVNLMYSPMEALEYAKREPDRLLYVTAVGFETTLPVYALLIRRLTEENIKNVRLLTAVKALMPALTWICENNPDIQGFIGPGHASAVLGWGGYGPLCRKYAIPMAVAGFGYEHIVAAIYDLMTQLTRGTCEVHNLYPRVVTKEGNQEALRLIDEFFERKPSVWRGLGEIEGSGYCLKKEYAQFDAGSFETDGRETSGCLCGKVITGRARPVDCKFFGFYCTPENPQGPCMVSSEGTCGIWHQNARTR